VIFIGANIEAKMISKRGLAQALRLTNRLTMLEHRAETLPLKFKNVPQTRPGGEWGYAKRDKEYMKQKARRKKHQRPNVWDGDLEKAVLSTARVTATQHGARLIARGSAATPLTTARRKEIEMVSSTDQLMRQKSWLKTFVQVIQQPQFKKKKRTRAADGRFTKG